MATEVQTHQNPYEQLPGESQETYAMRLELQNQSSHAAMWKRWFIGASAVAVVATGAAIALSSKKAR